MVVVVVVVVVVVAAALVVAGDDEMAAGAGEEEDELGMVAVCGRGEAVGVGCAAERIDLSSFGAACERVRTQRSRVFDLRILFVRMYRKMLKFTTFTNSAMLDHTSTPAVLYLAAKQVK